MDSDGLGHGLPLFTLKNTLSLGPQSLRARLIALLLASVLAGQIATLYLVSQYQRNHAQTVALDLIATTIRALHFSMEHAAPADRAEFVRQASEGQWRLWTRPLPNDVRLLRRPTPASTESVRIQSAQERQANTQSSTRRLTNRAPNDSASRPNDSVQGERATSASDRSINSLLESLNERLSGDSRIAVSYGQPPELYISLPQFTEPVPGRLRDWLVIPLEQLKPPLASSLIAYWLMGLLVIMFVGVLFSWHVTRPITRLMQATDKLAAGTPAPVDPTGPTELRVLGERFNAMLAALRASESTKRTLLAGLPHDLKAPLSRMWLRVEMSEEPTLKEGMRSDLQDMQHIVDQFVHYLRGTDLESYRFTIFSLDQWLRERVRNCQQTGQTIVLEGLPARVSINADQVALSRLLDNLIGNALHHGAPPVHISLRTEGLIAVLTVSDHGQGIPLALRLEALKPFVRLDEARTRSGNVGLGLALVDSIVRAHAGTLTLDQSPAGGLQVEVRLPILARD
jgi:two-component system osmolarity sensor histidine kinase EnvZ